MERLAGGEAGLFGHAVVVAEDGHAGASGCGELDAVEAMRDAVGIGRAVFVREDGELGNAGRDDAAFELNEDRGLVAGDDRLGRDANGEVGGGICGGRVRRRNDAGDGEGGDEDDRGEDGQVPEFHDVVLRGRAAGWSPVRPVMPGSILAGAGGIRPIPGGGLGASTSWRIERRSMKRRRVPVY